MLPIPDPTSSYISDHKADWGLGLAYSIPTTSAAMNYNSVILVGVVALTSIWWLVHGIRNYAGPRLTHLYIHEGIEQVSQVAAMPVQSKSEEKTVSSES